MVVGVEILHAVLATFDAMLAVLVADVKILHVVLTMLEVLDVVELVMLMHVVILVMCDADLLRAQLLWSPEAERIM